MSYCKSGLCLKCKVFPILLVADLLNIFYPHLQLYCLLFSKHTSTVWKTVEVKCPTTIVLLFMSFTVATAYLSLSLVGSHTHFNSSPIEASHTCLYSWYPRMQDCVLCSSMISLTTRSRFKSVANLF